MWEDGTSIAFDRTCFYPGGGGQPPDQGSIRLSGGALLEIESSRWALGAIYHSHPSGPARPSPTDLAEAYYPDALAVIVSLAGAIPRTGAFALDGERADRFVIADDGFDRSPGRAGG